jgi:hypothetical protein
MEARRFESPLLRADLVRVEWMAGEGSGMPGGNDGNDRFLTTEAVLEDISALGACVQLEEPIPPGTAISISGVSGETARLSGCVAYCIYRDYGYFVGIRFTNETVRSSPVFEPERLTNQTLTSPARR